MALAKSKPSHMPQDAVVLTEQQAVIYQSQIIQKWPSTSDVFGLRYGMYFLGGSAFLSGLFINSHFRRKFLLGSFGRFSTYLPTCIIPASTAIVVHTQTVLKDVILMKGDQCPVCLELRSAAWQSMLGTIFPLMVAPLGCASIAQRYATYNLPYITEKPGEIFNIFKNFFRPIRTSIWYIFVAQALVGSIVTYFEIRSIIIVNQKLALDEQQEHYS